MHPAGDGFVEPGMPVFPHRVELQAAFELMIKEEAARAGKVSWKVGSAFVILCGTGCRFVLSAVGRESGG